MNQFSELRDRVEARKKDLEAKLLEWKADTKGSFNEKIDQAENELKNLKEIVKDGWDRVTEPIAKKLNEWLSKNKGP